MDTAFIIPYRLRQVAGKPGLSVIFGVSNGTIERNVLQPMRDIYSDRLIGSIKGSKNTATIFGEEVYCIGTEKVSAVSKIQGMSVKYAYGDEIAKWNEDAFAMIESRLDKEYSKMDGACNPEGPNHWFKKWLDNPKLDAYIQHYVLFDNPFLPKNFIQSLCDEYEGTVYYQRYILGEWALAEGIIYPMYQKAIGEAPAGVETTEYCMSIDYGTENAFAAILWAHGSDDVWYAVDEYYYSGRDIGVPKTDEEYADDIERFARPAQEFYRNKYNEQLHLGDPLAMQQSLQVIVDPSAASFIATLRKRRGYKVLKANNDVSDGIRETAVCMKAGLIKISPKCKHGTKELEGYVWDAKASANGEDKPVKVADHFCDSLRYFCRTKHIVRKARNADLSGLTEG